MKTAAASTPKSHHLDRRADRMISSDVGDDDELLTTRQLADWLETSTQWAEIGRFKGYGPKFIKISPHQVRYRRGDVLEWLKARTYPRTSEYRTKKSA